MNLTDFSGQRPIVHHQGQISAVHLSDITRRTLGCLELLGLAGPSDTTSEPTERDDLFMVRDVR